jgi:hypothetical protein
MRSIAGLYLAPPLGCRLEANTMRTVSSFALVNSQYRIVTYRGCEYLSKPKIYEDTSSTIGIIQKVPSLVTIGKYQCVNIPTSA